MRYNFAYKTKVTSGCKNYSTAYSSITDPTDLGALGSLLAAMRPCMANNAKIQTSMVIDDVFDDEIELPDPASLQDEKDVTFYLGNKNDKSVFYTFTIGHVKKSYDIISPITELIEGEIFEDGAGGSGVSTSPFTDRNGVQLNKVIRAVEKVYNVVEGGI